MTDSSSSDQASRTSRGTTRQRLVDAMIKVVGSEGLQSASVRTIAKEAGCNEAVLYQHFPGKIAMQQAIYSEIILEMAEEKQQISRQATDIPRLVEDWVAATFRFYDEKPFAFAYVYLSYPPVTPEDPSVPGMNTRIFESAIRRLDPPTGQRLIFDEGTFASFRAALLGVPRSIHSGLLSGNAMDYHGVATKALSSMILSGK